MEILGMANILLELFPYYMYCHRLYTVVLSPNFKPLNLMFRNCVAKSRNALESEALGSIPKLMYQSLIKASQLKSAPGGSKNINYQVL